MGSKERRLGVAWPSSNYERLSALLGGRYGNGREINFPGCDVLITRPQYGKVVVIIDRPEGLKVYHFGERGLNFRSVTPSQSESGIVGTASRRSAFVPKQEHVNDMHGRAKKNFKRDGRRIVDFVKKMAEGEKKGGRQRKSRS